MSYYLICKMGLENIINNISISDLSPQVIPGFETLITILKAAGIVIIVYILFLIIKGFFTLKRYRKIKP